MTDWRTEAQRAADEELGAAVEKAVRAYDNLSPESVLIDFIVVGRGTRWNKKGHQIGTVFTNLKDGSMDIISIMGLISCAQAKWSSYAVDGDEIEEEDDEPGTGP